MKIDYARMALPFKVQQLLELTIRNKKLTILDALHYIYSSMLYKQMATKSSYLWQLSALNLYEMLKKEKRDIKRRENYTSDHLRFIINSIENYKVLHGINGEESIFLFEKYGVVKYLSNKCSSSYEYHTEFIMSGIDEHISKWGDGQLLP